MKFVFPGRVEGPILMLQPLDIPALDVQSITDNPFLDSLREISNIVWEVLDQQNKLYGLVTKPKPSRILDDFVSSVIEKAFTGLISKTHRSGICFKMGGKSKRDPYIESNLEFELAFSDKGWRKINHTDGESVSRPIFFELDYEHDKKQKLVQILFKDRAGEVERWLRQIKTRHNAVLDMYQKIKKGLQPYLDYLSNPAPHLTKPFFELHKKTGDNRDWVIPFINMEDGSKTKITKRKCIYNILGFTINRNTNISVKSKYVHNKFQSVTENPVDFNNVKTWILLAPYWQFILDMIKEAQEIQTNWFETHPATVVLTDLKERLLPVLILIGMDNERGN